MGAPASSVETLLARWIERPEDAVLDELARSLRGTGLLEATGPRVRDLATRAAAHAESESAPHPASFAVLSRLGSTGPAPPPYLDYIGWPLLAPLLPESRDAGLASGVLRLLHEVADELRDEELLARLEEGRRNRLVRVVTDFQARCRDLSAGLPVSRAHPDQALRVRVSALPESDLGEEVVFIRVLQATEVLFAAIAELLAEVADQVRVGHLAWGIPYLYAALPLADLLHQPLRFLAAMSVERWQELRPIIEENSAIHASHLHTVEATLPIVSRLQSHPRVVAHERDLVPVHEAAVDQVTESLRRWYHAHTRLACKYLVCPGGYLSDGAEWLRSQDDVALGGEIADSETGTADGPDPG